MTLTNDAAFLARVLASALRPQDPRMTDISEAGDLSDVLICGGRLDLVACARELLETAGAPGMHRDPSQPGFRLEEWRATGDAQKEAREPKPASTP